jgi:hypothetical protein
MTAGGKVGLMVGLSADLLVPSKVVMLAVKMVELKVMKLVES